MSLLHKPRYSPVGVRDLFREEDLRKSAERKGHACMKTTSPTPRSTSERLTVVSEWTVGRMSSGIPCRAGTLDARTIRVCGATTFERFTLTQFDCHLSSLAHSRMQLSRAHSWDNRDERTKKTYEERNCLRSLLLGVFVFWI
jgi:hypothetical protein